MAHNIKCQVSEGEETITHKLVLLTQRYATYIKQETMVSEYGKMKLKTLSGQNI